MVYLFKNEINEIVRIVYNKQNLSDEELATAIKVEKIPEKKDKNNKLILKFDEENKLYWGVRDELFDQYNNEDWGLYF